MKTLLDKLIDQLDTLISFLALSREDVFQLLNDHRLAWFPENKDALPAVYENYRKQINHSALLLGYSYFESFLNDLLLQILCKRPQMLPKAKKIDYSEILNSANKETLIVKIAQREIHELFYKNMADTVDELQNKFNLSITDEEKNSLILISFIRNCIIHNSSRADFRLARYDGFQEGHAFEVSTEKVHGYGLLLRSLVRRIYKDAQQKHGIDENKQ
ncbi:MAG: hypothetical protein WC082_00135 [Victivallales bacterium]